MNHVTDLSSRFSKQYKQFQFLSLAIRLVITKSWKTKYIFTESVIFQNVRNCFGWKKNKSAKSFEKHTVKDILYSSHHLLIITMLS